MFKRTLATLAALGLCLTFAAAAPAQERDDLQFNKRTFQGKEVIQAQAVLRLPAAPPELAEPDRRAHYQQAAVRAALDWAVRHGFHDDMHSIKVYNTSQGLVMVVHFAGGGNLTAFLGPGPFFPDPELDVEQLDALMNVTILRDLQVQEPVFNP